MRIRKLAKKEPITDEELATKKEIYWIRKLAKKERITEEELKGNFFVKYIFQVKCRKTVS